MTTARDALSAAIDAACPHEEGEHLLDAYRAEVVTEVAAALQAKIDRDRAYWPRRSNDRITLCGAREIVLSLRTPAAPSDPGSSR